MEFSKDYFLGGAILLINKPINWTSFQVVNKLRWLIKSKFNLKKRYNILFKLFNVKNIDDFLTKLNHIKIIFRLESNLIKINKKIPNKINLILDNVNIQRLTNNPVIVTKKNIMDILNTKIKEAKN